MADNEPDSASARSELRPGQRAVASAAFLVAYGLAIFFATRAYYTSQPPRAAQSVLPATPAPTVGAASDPALPPNHPDISALATQLASNDPVQLAEQADAAFEKKDNTAAAQLYARALELAPDNPALYNNLGLTLFYLGRVDEALEKLQKGTEVDPQMQRLWLTLGFVQANAQHIDDAKKALQKAIELGADNGVGREAKSQLDALGP